MLLEVDRLSVRFGGLRALAHVSVGVEADEIVGLVGPNGAGKSTLVNAVSGTLGRLDGRIAFAGNDINGMSPSDIAALGLLRTFQLVQPFHGLTTFECAMLGALYGSADARPKSLRSAQKLAEEALEITGLSDAALLACETLNASQRRRLEIARALAARPRLVLLDESLSGLNSVEIEEGLCLIRAIRKRGIAILIVEHLVPVMADLADRIVVLERGTKIADGPAATVLTDRRALDVYFRAPAGAP
jgi:branched-chain amino acid transport system ATP-binding protein